MAPTRTIRFDNGSIATLAELAVDENPVSALHDLGLLGPAPVLVLVGGADGLEAMVARRLGPVFSSTLARVLDRLGATVIDGGTDAGVMGLMGRARLEAKAGFPLLGIAAKGTVYLPAMTSAAPGGSTRLEPNHTHFLLVPGHDWGDEAPKISAVAAELSSGRSSATLVVGGGKITWLDLQLSLQARRPSILLAGSGGTADSVVDALGTGDLGSIGIGPDQAGLLRIVELDTAERDLPDLLASLLLAGS